VWRIGVNLGQGIKKVDPIRQAYSPNYVGHGLRPRGQYNSNSAWSISEELNSLDRIMGSEVKSNSLSPGGFESVVL
jgi:hypothetical protein